MLSDGVTAITGRATWAGLAAAGTLVRANVPGVHYKQQYPGQSESEDQHRAVPDSQHQQLGLLCVQRGPKHFYTE